MTWSTLWRVLMSLQTSWAIWTPKSGPPGRSVSPGTKFCWISVFAVRVVKALPWVEK
ncbi:MAG: hypothetical protein IPK00_23795 [Deltaproteobacteria bacterium]|nr:hypothetical protein [Deltaproteobacteria bacterium]